MTEPKEVSKKETICTLQLKGDVPLTAKIVLADPDDGTGLLDLEDIIINSEAITTTKEAGTEVLNAITHLQDALTSAIKAEL